MTLSIIPPPPPNPSPLSRAEYMPAQEKDLTEKKLKNTEEEANQKNEEQKWREGKYDARYNPHDPRRHDERARHPLAREAPRADPVRALEPPLGGLIERPLPRRRRSSEGAKQARPGQAKEPGQSASANKRKTTRRPKCLTEMEQAEEQAACC